MAASKKKETANPDSVRAEAFVAELKAEESVAVFAENRGLDADVIWDFNKGNKEVADRRESAATAETSTVSVHVPRKKVERRMAEVGKRVSHKRKKYQTKCPLCGNLLPEAPKKTHIKTGKQGDHRRDTGRMIKEMWNITVANKYRQHHPWYLTHNTIEAHHLLSCDTFNEPLWHEVCRTTGYNPNRGPNGAFFPAKLELACLLQKPLHFGNHSGKKSPHYPTEVNREAEQVLENFITGKFCDDAGKTLIEKLDMRSKLVLSKINRGKLFLTTDAEDYLSAAGIGCGGKSTLTAKDEARRATDDDEKLKPCELKSDHLYTKKNGETWFRFNDPTVTKVWMAPVDDEGKPIDDSKLAQMSEKEKKKLKKKRMTESSIEVKVEDWQLQYLKADLPDIAVNDGHLDAAKPELEAKPKPAPKPKKK
ncbi:MAG: AHH domain-containing protein [Planctomycetota bacterium]|jgi:hypothetical protein|nr:AHH domain-containing protein [Planctomycetota bacterium]